MANRTAKKVVDQAIQDFDDIKDAIIGHKIPVPYATPTSMYAPLIAGIRVGSISGKIDCKANITVCNTVNDICTIYPTAKTVGTIAGKASVIDEE